MDFDPDQLLNALRGLPAAQRYWVAFSGGLDSTVLLQAMAQIRDRLHADLRAVHVNHHLHPRSDDWQQHCRGACAALQVACECRAVRVTPAKGQSLEAVARACRYAAYRELLQAGDLLLLAQHQDDQLETFLLQALRGAGVQGLAAMPVTAACGAGRVARPLLGFTRAQLQAWALQQDLDWLEDPSNSDLRFDRNYLRHRVLPLLRARWPAAAATASRSTRHCGEALELLTALAGQDLARCTDSRATSLAIAPLRELGAVRVKNLLRLWLERLHCPPPPAHKLERIFAEVLEAREDRNPCVAWGGVELRRYRQRLHVAVPLPEAPGGELCLRPGAELDLGPALGVLSLQAGLGEGVRDTLCPAGGFRVRFRSGGEVCRPVGRGHHRPLKKWLQDYGVLPWMRAHLPLIYAGEDLAAVAGLFVCAPFAAGQGEAGLRICWRAHPQLQE